MSLDLRIILDKSVIHGLSNQEIDSLDRYFFQIIPPISLNEILAGLTKERGENRISNAAHRVSGNGGLAFNYREILGNSLIGNEVPMDGRFLPAGEKMVRSSSGSIGTVIDTTKEQEAIFRWERKNFQESEKTWASALRRHYERPINSKMYVDEVLKASLVFETPKNDSGLAKCVDLILNDKKFQGEILVLLAKEFKMPLDFQKKVINRWFKEGKPMIKDFAPYAYFCSKANFLWAIGLTNSSLFNHDKNDRKDLEYSYYIPFCQIFASKDKKHKRLIPFLLRPTKLCRWFAVRYFFTAKFAKISLRTQRKMNSFLKVSPFLDQSTVCKAFVLNPIQFAKSSCLIYLISIQNQLNSTLAISFKLYPN